MKNFNSSTPILLPGDSFYLLDSEFDADMEMESELRLLNHDGSIHGPSYEEEDETIN